MNHLHISLLVHSFYVLYKVPYMHEMTTMLNEIIVYVQSNICYEMFILLLHFFLKILADVLSRESPQKCMLDYQINVDIQSALNDIM